MVTITEDYVSFETAKLLKENGFDEKCLHYYEDNRHRDEGIKFSDWCIIKYSNSEIGRRFACPTLQMACKWLRIKHNLCVTPIMTSKVIRDEYGCWEANIYYYEGEFAGIDATINACGHIFGETPEDVLEEGIKYCLENLI